MYYTKNNKTYIRKVSSTNTGLAEAIEDIVYTVDIAYRTNITNKLYCYYQRGKIAIVNENINLKLPWKLLQGEYIPKHLTVIQLYGYFMNRLRSVPCLP